MNPLPILEFGLLVHQQPFVWMAVFISASFMMALFFALIISILNGERKL